MAELDGELDELVDDEPRTLSDNELFKLELFEPRPFGWPGPRPGPPTPAFGSYWREMMSSTRDMVTRWRWARCAWASGELDGGEFGR